MEYKSDVIKNQKFEIGRTINFSLCNCEKCDFFNCPKKNYCLKTKPHKYSVLEFCESNINYILEKCDTSNDCKNFKLTYDLLSEFLDDCVQFPKGLFWSLQTIDNGIDKFEDSKCSGIHFVKFTRTGKELLVCEIKISTEEIYDYYSTETQYNFVKKTIKDLNKIKEFVIKYNNDKN